MWKRFTNWLRGLFGIKRKDINEITGSLLTSDDMEAAQDLWRLAFINKPPWYKNGEYKTTKFPGVVTAYAATLCASEIKLSSGNGVRAEWVQEQINRYVMLDIRNYIQESAALSYVVLKPCPEGKNIYCDIATPETFFPTVIKGGRIQSGVFLDMEKVKDGSKITEYIRLEEHAFTDGTLVITNRAYKADNVKKGAEIPLATVPAWADLSEEITINNLERPLFAVLKMPFANQVDMHSKLPVSMYSNAMEAFEKIDRLYNDFLWEMESGRRKQIFDITAVKSDGRITQTDLTRYKTTDQYIVLDMGNGEKPYDDYTPEMRVEAYQAAINTQVRLMETQIGMSTGTFDFDIKSGVSRAVTATEVISDERDTYNTIKGIQENGLEQGLLDLVYIYDVYATLYGLAPAGTIEPSVEFGDSIFEDTNTEFIRRKSLADSGYYKPELLNAWYFGVDEETAKQMIPEKQAVTGLFGTQTYGAGEDEA